MDRIAPVQAEELPDTAGSPTGNSDRRRFTRAVTVGGVVVAVPYLWVLTDLWIRSPSLLRTVNSSQWQENFYDLQARAMLHGHLYVPKGSLGPEAFVHDGRQYTYFGVFPSLLRMPILVFTHSLDGRLTAPSILLAWIITGLFTSMLLWRVRLLVRGTAALGRTEAVASGVLVATVLGGSVLVELAANPWVYSEDIAWSVALTVGSLFALLGVLEAPSWGRVTATGVLTLAANLTRGSTGYACVIAAVLAAVWFASGRGGRENRRWWLPVLAAGIIPVLVESAVSWAKFGIPFGYPLHDQIYFNAMGLNRIPGSYFSVRYLPTTVVTYLVGPGFHASSVFPFITLPLYPARAVGGVPLYGSEEVTSILSSMPLLFLLSIWGSITALRLRTTRRARLTAIPLIGAAAAGALILIFGFLDDRFLGDFLPFLVLASSVGMVDVWRRLEGRRPQARRLALGAVAVLGLFGIAVNLAISITPSGWWTPAQTLRFVDFQKSVSDLTGHPLASSVTRVKTLPASAPIDGLFEVGDCDGLYIFPIKGLKHWFALGAQVTDGITSVNVTLRGTTSVSTSGVRILSVGTTGPTVLTLDPDGIGRVRFVLDSPDTRIAGTPVDVRPGRTYRARVDADLDTDHLSVTSTGGPVLLEGKPGSRGPVVVYRRSIRSRSGVGVADVTVPRSERATCRGLVSRS